MKLRLAMIGFGNVGQAFARLLISKKEWLREAYGLEVEVLAISTRNRGSLMSKKAIDLQRVLGMLERGEIFRDSMPEHVDLSPLEIIEGCDANLMVELTTLNIDSGQPAIDHIRKALSRGMHIVTANKGPIAYAYDELSLLARSRGLQFRFEGTVMDGTPVFNLAKRTLPGCEIESVQGLLNSTSNFILTEMSMGISFEEALDKAIRVGVAEADPSLDIDGWDAAAKITVLANVLMGARSTPKEVNRTGIRGINPESLRKAAASGMKYKLVARAEKANGQVETCVRPELVGPDNL
ncbi:MAG: homoserine dehydrogenase, partial [Candidatus Bathyarchaeota archaeon]|nr:homoserine dehydrogenase [Candidatus Bathyarchaeota archaeon]